MTSVVLGSLLFLFASCWVGGKTLADAFVLFLSLFGFDGF
jgi:hypothetical protein